jgi:hypothetical protein
MSDLTNVPATIELRVREGVPNVLHSFELGVRDSRPTEDGRTEHEASVVDIVWALARTLRQQAEYLIENTSEDGRKETRERVEALVEWVAMGVTR